VTIHQDFLKKELVFDSIVGRYKNLKEVLLCIVMIMLCDLFVPSLEFMSLNIDSLLVYIQLSNEVSLLADLLLEVEGKFVSV